MGRVKAYQCVPYAFFRAFYGRPILFEREKPILESQGAFAVPLLELSFLQVHSIKIGLSIGNSLLPLLVGQIALAIGSS